jgi:cytoskeletal protein RodZ
MNSIGKILKNARIKKKLSLSSLSDKTKIKRDFLDAIEKEEWEKLPEFPVVLGFVKSIRQRS